MAEYDDNENLNDERQPDIRSLRKAADEGRAAQAERDQLRRELMFARAGIDTESKLGRLLFKTFEGDSADALKAEAAELGYTIPGSQPQPTNDDVRGQQEFRSSLQGSPPSAYEPESEDPNVVALRDFHEDLRNGVPRDRAQLAAFDKIFTAAVAGDSRVIFDPAEWTRQGGR